MREDSAEDDMPDGDVIDRVVGDSRVVQAVRGVGIELNERVTRATSYVEHSRLYGWLTKEPEPEVVVIDLRETYTIGPFIRMLDGLIERVQPYWEASLLKRGVDSLVSLGERASRTRVGRAVVAVLEPPEPPEEAATGGDADADIDGSPDGDEDPADHGSS